MDALLALALPIVLAWLLFSMLARLLLPGGAADTFVGHVARDIFWAALRGTVALLSLPFALLTHLISFHRQAHPSHARRRRRNRRK